MKLSQDQQEMFELTSRDCDYCGITQTVEQWLQTDPDSVDEWYCPECLKKFEAMRARSKVKQKFISADKLVIAFVNSRTDEPCLTVALPSPDGSTTMINHFIGERAKEIYSMLVTNEEII